MCMISRRPRPRKPIHPAECDVADKLRELEAALHARLACEGDPECVVDGKRAGAMLVSVRVMLNVFAPQDELATTS